MMKSGREANTNIINIIPNVPQMAQDNMHVNRKHINVHPIDKYGGQSRKMTAAFKQRDEAYHVWQE